MIVGMAGQNHPRLHGEKDQTANAAENGATGSFSMYRPVFLSRLKK